MPLDPSQLPSTESVEPVKLFGGIFVASSFAGLASLLRSKQTVTWRNIASAMLNSGFIAVIIAFSWYSSYKDTNLWFLVGVSLLAGLGGSTTIDFAFQYARTKLGFPNPNENPKPPAS